MVKQHGNSTWERTGSRLPYPKPRIRMTEGGRANTARSTVAISRLLRLLLMTVFRPHLYYSPPFPGQPFPVL